MKLLFTIICLQISGVIFAQPSNKSYSPFKIINNIFTNYIKNQENTASKETKDSMTIAINNLQFSSSKTELYLLINVWMYYDPTEYPTRQILRPLFQKNKLETIHYIDKRIKNKKNWEDRNTAPFAELYALREQLKKV